MTEENGGYKRASILSMIQQSPGVFSVPFVIQVSPKLTNQITGSWLDMDN